jgi:hypothetical protein
VSALVAGLGFHHVTPPPFAVRAKVSNEHVLPLEPPHGALQKVSFRDCPSPLIFNTQSSTVSNCKAHCHVQILFPSGLQVT